MIKKTIKTIVFYRHNSKNMATIFYKDGSVEKVSYDEASKVVEQLARTRGYTKSTLKDFLNEEDIVKVVSEEDYIKNYKTYLGKSSVIDKEIKKTLDEKLESIAKKPEEIVIDIPDYQPVYENEVLFFNKKKEECIDPAEDEEVENLMAEELGYKNKGLNRKTNTSKKIKNNNKKGIIKRVTAFALALLIGAGIYSCASRKSKEGVILNNDFKTSMSSTPIPTSAGKTMDNSEYNNYSYSQLLDVTNNKNQKTYMNYLGATLINFNTKFANAYVEEDKDVKAALSVDEMASLQQAYSNYTANQIRVYYNGSETDSVKMTRDYKNASLQLMGAYVIETRENPVDMSWLIDSQEGRNFYFKYHSLFLDAKEAVGTDKLMKINNFFNAVREDFPITKEIRTEGISHADSYYELESYKLSVTPMIAAAEMMFQNLESDLTLNDSEIDFINDLGLCEYASKKFEKIEHITMNSKEDKTNPKYEQYQKALEKELKEKDNYVVNDARRDLSRLSSFQSAVNWHFEVVEGEFTGNISYGTVTTYTTEEETISKPIPADKRAEIDAKIAAENENARREGEAAARRTQEQRQAEEDENARRVAQEVANDNANLQNQINNANNKINNNQSVNESDFNGYVTFDDNHKDSNGNLNDSVQNITTDPSGDKTNDPLPDPNAMGANFDQGQPFSVEEESEAAKKIDNMSYEELVDAYIATLAENEIEGAYTYHK